MEQRRAVWHAVDERKARDQNSKNCTQVWSAQEQNDGGNVDCSGKGCLWVWRGPKKALCSAFKRGQALKAEPCLLEEKKLWGFQSKSDSQKNTFPKWTEVQEQVAYITQVSSRFPKFWSR